MSTNPSIASLMSELEKLTQSLENGQIPLEDLVIKYQEAVQKVALIKKKLKSIEIQVEKINLSTKDQA